MPDEHDNDELLRRLAAAAPPTDDAEPPGERDRVWGRVQTAAPPRSSWRSRRLAVGAAVLAATAVLVVLVFGGSGPGSGPDRALAIERGPDGVTLTITNADASADEMNSELEDAGIESVRVFVVPGSPNHAGTWAGMIPFFSTCDGAPTSAGGSVRIARHTIDAPPAPGRDFVNLTLPNGQQQAFNAGLVFQSDSSRRAVVRPEAEDEAPTVLIAIRARSASDSANAKDFGLDQLKLLGGAFSPYADALADGDATCEEMGWGPPPPPASARLPEALRDGPLIGKCAVRVTGHGLRAFAGSDIKASTARAIHRCSKRVIHKVRHEHRQLRASREDEIQQIQSVAELPAPLQDQLEAGRASSTEPGRGVDMTARGLDTGPVVISDYDGHKHRTAPKRSGEYINLHCAARGGQDRELNATTFLNGAPIANSRVSCKAHGPFRSTHVAKVGAPGLYEIHLNGQGFDDFIIRARGINP